MENVKQKPNKGKKANIRMIVGMGLLTAIVVVLQILASNIRLGMFTITLCLAPIAVGAALYGWLAGVWLGFAFGMVVMFTDTAFFMAINPFGTIVTVMLKGMLAGLAAGLIYKLASKVNGYFGVFCSAIVAPIVNTGVFLLGCKLFFMDTITSWAEAAGSPNVGSYIILSFVGINFLIELGVNMVCSPIILRLINIRKKEG